MNRADSHHYKKVDSLVVDTVDMELVKDHLLRVEREKDGSHWEETAEMVFAEADEMVAVHQMY